MIDPASVANVYGAAAKRAAGGDTDAGETGGFTDMLKDIVETTKASELAALQGAASQGDLLDIVTSISAADLTIQTVVAVRDKVIEAYQDIMRMPI